MTAISHSLPYAVGIILSSGPFLAIPLLLLSGRRILAATTFVSGWMTGIVGVAGLLTAFVDTSHLRTPRRPAGYGHVFAGEHYVDAWLALTSDDGERTAKDAARLKQCLKRKPWAAACCLG